MKTLGFSINSHEFKLAVGALLLIPLVVMILLAVQLMGQSVWRIFCSCLPARRTPLQSTAIICSFMLHPIITDVFLKAIDCERFDTWRLRDNTLVACGSEPQLEAQNCNHWSLDLVSGSACGALYLALCESPPVVQTRGAEDLWLPSQRIST